MKWVGVLAAAVLIVVVLVDAFEVMLLPRRVRHGLRLARVFYRTSWMIGRTSARLLPAGDWRTAFSAPSGRCRCWCWSCSGPWDWFSVSP